MTEVFESVFASIDGIIFRCRNDEDYTMEMIVGAVEGLTGYPREALLNNAETSWVGITHPDDIDSVVAAVDAAIEKRGPWEMSYRVVRPDGALTWVRERGCAIFEGEDLIEFSGLIHDGNQRDVLQSRLALDLLTDVEYIMLGVVEVE